MICPSCGTWNKDESLFCKYCGFDLSKAPKPVVPPTPAPVPPPPAAAPPVVPRPPPPRTWWHGLGVFVILAVALVVIDLAANQRITWSFVGVLSVAFIVGGVMILQFLANAERRDRRPFVAGAVLIIVAVLLLPVAISLQSSPTFTDTYTVPNRSGVNTVSLDISDEAGQITVQFASNPGYLVRADVTHLGGLFSSHFPGDVVVSNRSSGGTLNFTLSAKGVSGLFFLGGHDILVTVSESVAVTLELTSSTGGIGVVVPAGVAVTAGGIVASVATGSVSIQTTDVAFRAGSSVRAASTTGSVTLSVTQSTVYAGTVSVTGTSTTGSVSFTFNRAAGIAAQVTSTVTTGSVNPDTSKYSGVSNALLYAPDQATYQASTMHFLVTLESTTGNIDLR